MVTAGTRATFGTSISLSWICFLPGRRKLLVTWEKTKCSNHRNRNKKSGLLLEDSQYEGPLSWNGQYLKTLKVRRPRPDRALPYTLTPLIPSSPAPGTWTTRSSITTCGTSTISSKLRGSSLFRENGFQKKCTKCDFSEKSLSTFFLQCCELVHVTYMTSPHESRWDPVLPVVEENHCTPQGTKKVWSSKNI